MNPYRCEECDLAFEGAKEYAGHRGGKHGRELVDIRHGTEYGYVQHIRREVPVDDDDTCGCRAAHATYQAERRKRLATSTR